MSRTRYARLYRGKPPEVFMVAAADQAGLRVALDRVSPLVSHVLQQYASQAVKDPIQTIALSAYMQGFSDARQATEQVPEDYSI